VDLGPGATLIFGDVAITVFVLGGRHLVGAWPRETFCYVLEARILGGLRSARVHDSMHLLHAGSVIVPPGPWDRRVSLNIFLDVNFFEMVT